ncbi:uncharacterized protein BDZ99DRAFT_377819, partial [Mytilinidion resinicola]
LPQTIKDAILVTWKLGIRYLWVDALCIVQKAVFDSKNGISIHDGEWAVEANNMASVYGNAYITIMAASAADCQDGFLKLSWISEKCRTPRESNGGLSTYYLLLDVEFALHSSPLYGRGWAFQESVLSRRLLIFVKNEILWLCDYVFNRMTSEGWIDHTGYVSSLRSRHNNGLLTVRDWSKWAKDYSSRETSHASDRLAALSGVIHHFAQENNDTSVLGLWRSDIPLGLLWKPMGITPTARIKRAEFFMPTWS